MWGSAFLSSMTLAVPELYASRGSDSSLQNLISHAEKWGGCVE